MNTCHCSPFVLPTSPRGALERFVCTQLVQEILKHLTCLPWEELDNVRVTENIMKPRDQCAKLTGYKNCCCWLWPCVKHALASVEDDDNTSQNISSTYRNTYALKHLESHLLKYKVMFMATNIFRPKVVAPPGGLLLVDSPLHMPHFPIWKAVVTHWQEEHVSIVNYLQWKDSFLH